MHRVFQLARTTLTTTVPSSAFTTDSGGVRAVKYELLFLVTGNCSAHSSGDCCVVCSLDVVGETILSETPIQKETVGGLYLY